MAWYRKLIVLLSVLIRTIHTDLEIKTEGESYRFDLSADADYCLLSRSADKGNLLLWNTSHLLETSTLVGEIQDRLDVNNSSLQINSLIQSDSGLYLMECWKDDRVSYQNNTDLSVCSKQSETTALYANPGETLEVQCESTLDGGNLTVRWFQKDTKSRKIVQLSKNSSHHIANITIDDIWYFYYICVILDGQLCVSRQIFNPQLQRQYVALSVGEEAVLPCFNPDDHTGMKTGWRTSPFGYLKWDPNHLTRGKKHTFVSDGRKSGSYSLVMPSLKSSHSGLYFCCDQLQGRETFIKGYKLLVCFKSKQLTEFFSEGQEVVLSCNSDLIKSDRVVWYRQTAQVDDVILDTEYQLASYPEDLDGRINVSDPLSFLVLSNLSLTDRGEYWCAVFYKKDCVSVTKTVLLEWDPFGINSMFYRVYSSLMGCALLGMFCVLITVNLKTRRRDQGSLKTRRTAAQRQRNSTEEEEKHARDEGKEERKEKE